MGTWTAIAIAIGLAVPVGIVLWVGLQRARWHRAVRADVAEVLAEYSPDPEPAITADDLQALPEPVQRWLRAAGVVGMRPVRTYRLRMRGRMRTAPGEDWLPLAVEEVGRVPSAPGSPAWVWTAQTTLNGMPLCAHDRYRDGHGQMRLRLAHFFSLSNQVGAAVDTASLVRAFASLPWLPTFALDPRIQWTEVDTCCAEGTLHDGSLQATARFSIDQRGRVTDVRSERPRATGGGFVPTPWHMPLAGAVEVQGLQVPASSQAIWHLDTGSFAYVELTHLDSLRHGHSGAPLSDSTSGHPSTG